MHVAVACVRSPSPEGLALLEALTKASARGLVLGSGSFPLQLLRLREECEGLKRSEGAKNGGKAQGPRAG